MAYSCVQYSDIKKNYKNTNYYNSNYIIGGAPPTRDQSLAIINTMNVGATFGLGPNDFKHDGVYDALSTIADALLVGTDDADQTNIILPGLLDHPKAPFSEIYSIIKYAYVMLVGSLPDGNDPGNRGKTVLRAAHTDSLLTSAYAPYMVDYVYKYIEAILRANGGLPSNAGNPPVRATRYSPAYRSILMEIRKTFVTLPRAQAPFDTIEHMFEAVIFRTLLPEFDILTAANRANATHVIRGLINTGLFKPSLKPTNLEWAPYNILPTSINTLDKVLDLIVQRNIALFDAALAAEIPAYNEAHKAEGATIDEKMQQSHYLAQTHAENNGNDVNLANSRKNYIYRDWAFLMLMNVLSSNQASLNSADPLQAGSSAEIRAHVPDVANPRNAGQDNFQLINYTNNWGGITNLLSVNYRLTPASFEPFFGRFEGSNAGNGHDERMTAHYQELPATLAEYRSDGRAANAAGAVWGTRVVDSPMSIVGGAINLTNMRRDNTDPATLVALAATDDTKFTFKEIFLIDYCAELYLNYADLVLDAAKCELLVEKRNEVLDKLKPIMERINTLLALYGITGNRLAFIKSCIISRTLRGYFEHLRLSEYWKSPKFTLASAHAAPAFQLGIPAIGNAATVAGTQAYVDAYNTKIVTWATSNYIFYIGNRLKCFNEDLHDSDIGVRNGVGTTCSWATNNPPVSTRANWNIGSPPPPAPGPREATLNTQGGFGGSGSFMSYEF